MSVSADTLDFTHPSSRIAFATASSQMRLKRPLNAAGTLSFATTASSQITGNTVIADNVSFEESATTFALTGTFDPSQGSSIKLVGNQELFQDSGSLTSTVQVSGSGNAIYGQSQQGSPIILSDGSTEVTLHVARALEQQVHLNGGKVILGEPLDLGATTSLGTVGTIDCAQHRLGLMGTDSAWSSTLTFHNANIKLNNNLTLSGLWAFGPGNGTSVIDGGGHILDLTTCGTIALLGGHGLLIRDTVIKGVGQEQGSFIFYDQNATLSLSDVTFALASSYTFSVGNVYCKDQISQLNTSDNYLTFSYAGKLTLDGTTLVVDSLDKVPVKTIVPSQDNGVNLSLINDGRMVSTVRIAYDNSFFIDYGQYASGPHDELDKTRPLIARGDYVSGPMILDGSGGTLEFANEAAAMLKVIENNSLEVRNVVLDGFRPEHLSVAATSTLIFGNDITIRLRDDIELTYAWTFSSNAVIDGNGKRLTFGELGGITLTSGQMLFKDIILDQVQSGTNLLPLDSQSSFSFSNVTLNFTQNFTHERGYFDCFDQVKFSGVDKYFVLNASEPFMIHSNSDLMVDHRLTLSYQPSNASSTHFVFEDSSSCLHLNNATFCSTYTGAELSTGRVTIAGRSKLISLGRNRAEALVLKESLDVDILPSSNLSISGIVAHAS